MELDPDTQFGEESKCINHLSALPNIRIIFLVESSTSCGYFGSTDGSGYLYYVYSMFTSIQPSLRCSSDPQLGNFGHFSTSIGHNFLCRRRRLRDRPSSRPPSSFPLGKSQMGFLLSSPAVLWLCTFHFNALDLKSYRIVDIQQMRILLVLRRQMWTV